MGRTAGSEGFAAAPTTLATLQSPLDKSNGRIFSGTIFTISGSRKRKRAEISTAVDGEGISIHSVRNPRLVTSYPVPPQTYFQSAPCSVCMKSTVLGASWRHTYAAISSAPLSSDTPQRSQLLHFVEQAKQSDSTPPIQHKRELEIDEGPLFNIETMPILGNDASDAAHHDVLVTTENGSLLCLSETLDDIRWQRKLADVSQGRFSNASLSKVEFSTVVDVSQACRGLLRGRGDVLAKLGGDGDTATVTTSKFMILAIVERRTSASENQTLRFLHLFAVTKRSADGVTSSAPPVSHLLTHDLSSLIETSKDLQGSVSYDLNAVAGLLTQLLHGKIYTFDFTALLPRLRSTIVHPVLQIESFVRISSSRLIATTTNACYIYDTDYNTIQSRQELDFSVDAFADTRKRKRASGDTLPALQLHTLIPSIGQAVGLQRNEVVALQVGDEKTSHHPGHNGRTLLINALGKGIHHQKLESHTPDMATMPKYLYRNKAQVNVISSADWEQAKLALDVARGAENVSQFEDLFAGAVGAEVAISRDQPQTKGINGGSDISNDLESSSENVNGTEPRSIKSTVQYTWPTDRILSPYPQHLRQQALYALGHMFSSSHLAESNGKNTARSEHQHSLHIKFFPPNVFRWLVVNNFLTAEMISQAIKRHSPSNLTPGPVSAAHIVSALVAVDPSTQALFTLITESSYLDIAQLTQAIRIYIESHSSQSIGNSEQRALPAPVTNGGSMEYEAEEDGGIEELLSRADADISRAESILDDTFELRTIGLKHALIKLYVFPRATLTQTLRRDLDTHEIRFLIHILRIELQDGGWVSRYLDAGPSILRVADERSEEDGIDTSTRGPSDGAVTIVSSLLSCCVDAIGIGGWLTSDASHDRSPSLAGTPDDLDPYELIKIMYNETVAVLEGLHEVNFIGNTVTDFLRYAERLRVSQPRPNLKERNKKARKDGQMTSPYAIHVGNEGREDAIERLKAAIPLGGKLSEHEKRIQATKIVAGGEIKPRSKREVGMEISKKVGKYSLEKVRV